MKNVIRETSETEAHFKKGDRVKVRNLVHPYEVVFITHNLGKKLAHRYYLKCTVDGVLQDLAEAYAADMELAPVVSEPAQELTLVLEPDAPNEAPSAPSDGVAMHHAHVPGRLDPDERMPAGSFGGDTDEYSAAGRSEPDLIFGDMVEVLKPKERRYFPQRTSMNPQSVVYRSYFKGMENVKAPEDDEMVPREVVVTKETNGYAVWIEIAGFECYEVVLEEFYPAALKSREGAIEHGVLLALRKISPQNEDIAIELSRYI
jgi:hypothetical protein